MGFFERAIPDRVLSRFSSKQDKREIRNDRTAKPSVYVEVGYLDNPTDYKDKVWTVGVGESIIFYS